MNNRVYPGITDLSKIDFDEASKYWSEEERKAFDNFIDVLTSMAIKYAPQLLGEEVKVI